MGIGMNVAAQVYYGATPSSVTVLDYYGAPPSGLALPVFRGNHLSNTTCLTQVFSHGCE